MKELLELFPGVKDAYKCHCLCSPHPYLTVLMRRVQVLQLACQDCPSKSGPPSPEQFQLSHQGNPLPCASPSSSHHNKVAPEAPGYARPVANSASSPTIVALAQSTLESLPCPHLLKSSAKEPRPTLAPAILPKCPSVASPRAPLAHVYSSSSYPAKSPWYTYSTKETFLYKAAPSRPRGSCSTKFTDTDTERQTIYRERRCVQNKRTI